MDRHISLRAYAKINLGLAVLGRRADGYHELRTVYQSISLADELRVSLLPGSGVSLATSGIEVPTENENLAARAAAAILTELKLRQRVAIALRKRIPPGGGLGGGSSDAAAVLRAVLFLSGKKLPPDRLVHLAASLGSDVPFFLLGGRALGIGRGEEVYPLAEGSRQHCVLLVPEEGISTAEAYRRLRLPLLATTRAPNAVDLFCGRAGRGEWRELGNSFEKVAFQMLPRLAALKRQLLRAGAEWASLSGSGSALYGMFPGPAQARAAAERLRQPGCRVYAARTVSRREFQKPLLPAAAPPSP